MDTTFQPKASELTLLRDVSRSDKTQWTNTELLQDLLRKVNEMIAQLQEAKKKDGQK